MKPLVSVLTWTRDRPEGMLRTIAKTRASANHPDRLEFIIKLDDDNVLPYDPLRSLPYVKVRISHRGRGYGESCRFSRECLELATGIWAFVIDDDSWIVGQGWDDKLAEIEPLNCAAQPERYHLGFSMYGPNSCGPTGLFLPLEVVKSFAPYEGAADAQWSGYVQSKQWPVHLLPGVIYRHDRKDEVRLSGREEP